MRLIKEEKQQKVLTKEEILKLSKQYLSNAKAMVDQFSSIKKR